MSGKLSISTPNVVSRDFRIVNQRGLHARASAKFVQTVELYQTHVTVQKGADTVGGTSIMGLMMLAAGPGSELCIQVDGRQAVEALAALAALVENRFDEQD